ncbi:MAG: hypothetical protein K0S68_582 [Candidatus Saccharibacteria bacterium]|nr:hypothetical protein [Candidatus Saccharibacteria bacterium]
MKATEHYQYCPYCSHKLGPYRDFHRTCTNCHASWFENLAAATGMALLNAKHQVLLTRRAIEPSQGTYSLPGGFINPGESAEKAALREIEEETGLTDLDLLDYIGSFPDQYGVEGSHTLSLVFVGRLRSGEPHPDDDVEALEWHDVMNIPPEALADSFPNVREALVALQHWYENGGRDRLSG